MYFIALSSLLIVSATFAQASVTLYGQIPLAQTVSGSGAAAAATLAAYDETVLKPPIPPSPAIAAAFTLDLQNDAADVNGLSIPHTGSAFFGFSIEMSVINQVLGKNSSFIQVPFLNLMSNLEERAGSVTIRLGGNTQEYATMVGGLENGKALEKQSSGSVQTTETPAVLYTVDMFYIAANISQMVNVKWFLGIPFNDSSSWRLEIAQYGQTILGNNLLGLQAGNEPDLYAAHSKRPKGYGPSDYFAEVGSLIETIDGNPNIPANNKFVAPSVASSGWTPEDVWNTNFIPTYRDRLYALSVEHYPNNNCFSQFGVGSYVDPQEVFPSYLTHSAGVDLCAPYLNSSMIAQEAGLPFIMFETNTASCGGFPGVSDSYGAALWALDYGFQMAYSNFSNALLHVGGQNVYYNPFTSPPTNQSTYNDWTVGAIFYSALIMAEAFGKTGTSRIMDLRSNSVYTPSYAIYEEDKLSKVALFNYIDDASGANNIEVSITAQGGVPPSVRVKYLESESVTTKTNITWAGQTFGNKFEVDGRLKGDLNIVTIACDQGNNVCRIPVNAPGFALVLMEDSEAATLGQATETFAVTAYTKSHNTVTADPLVLSTSNGHSGKERAKMGSTSQGSVSGGVKRFQTLLPGIMLFVPVLARSVLLIFAS